MKAILTVCAVCAVVSFASAKTVNEEAKQFRYSTTVEKERPQLNETTKALIAAYRRDPSEANRAALEAQAQKNYEAVLDRKKAKLEELRREAGPEKIREMEEIVEEMIKGRDTRIAQTMARFTDRRLSPNAREATTDGFHALLGAGADVSIAHAPVTAGEYAEFCRATGRAAPDAAGINALATHVSLAEANAFCAWRSSLDPKFEYRLPTAEEWELAAGHMPKDADFATITGACGGIGFWGTVWQWTSTTNENGEALVKGGAADSPRTRCRTEIRDETRDAKKSYENVGFRVVREDK